jgi:hypothetical protein
MQMSKKIDDRRQSPEAAESNNNQKETGLVLTTRQGWLLVIGILILFATLLFFGYQDWQRQYRIRLEFEEHLRSFPPHGVLEKTQLAGTISYEQRGGT